MSYNGSGTFNINSTGQPVVTGTVISSTVFNALTADLATGLSTAITKDGQTATTAMIPFAQGIRSTLTTNSTTTSSGSLIVDGGVGIAKDVYVGGNVTVTGIVTATSAASFTNLVATTLSVTGTTNLVGALTYAGTTLAASVTGTGGMVLQNSAFLSAPLLSAPTVNGGTFNAPTLSAPVLGTPASGTLTNCAGLPVSTGISGLGTGVATFLTTPSSANLAAAVTDETGTGALVFQDAPFLSAPTLSIPTINGGTLNAPTLSAPVLGTPASGTLSNCTGLPVSTGISGLGTGVATFLATPSSSNLASAVTDETGTGALVFQNAPFLSAPTLSIPVVNGGTLNASTLSAGVLTGSLTAGGSTGTNGYYLQTTGTGVQWAAVAAGSSAFSSLTGGTNTSAAMVVGTGASLAATGTGTITATAAPLSGVSGLGTGVATFLATPSSANLATAVTDETGSGALVFATSPTLTTPTFSTSYVSPAWKPASNSTTAIQIQTSTGTNVLNVDTTNSRVGIGTTSPTVPLEVNGAINDSKGNVRDIPQNSQTTSYTLVVGDAGKHISTTAGVTVPASVFSAGNAVTIYNNSASSITITQGTSATMYQVGTANTGNRTLAQRGLVTILCVASNTFVISGGGLS
jgi:hypothetical protein